MGFPIFCFNFFLSIFPYVSTRCQQRDKITKSKPIPSLPDESCFSHLSISFNNKIRICRHEKNVIFYQRKIQSYTCARNEDFQYGYTDKTIETHATREDSQIKPIICTRVLRKYFLLYKYTKNISTYYIYYNKRRVGDFQNMKRPFGTVF